MRNNQSGNVNNEKAFSEQYNQVLSNLWHTLIMTQIIGQGETHLTIDKDTITQIKIRQAYSNAVRQHAQPQTLLKLTIYEIHA